MIRPDSRNGRIVSAVHPLETRVEWGVLAADARVRPELSITASGGHQDIRPSLLSLACVAPIDAAIHL